MNKVSILSIFVIVAMLSLVPLTIAQTINAGANDIVINSKPPSNALILDQGHGDVRTPSGNTKTYYNVNWVLTDKNIIYVWDDESKPIESDNFTIEVAIAIVFAIALVLLAIIILIMKRN
jgi:hypothetical protein